MSDAFVRQGGDAALDVVGCGNEVRLRCTGPLVGEVAGSILHHAQVLHAQRGKLAQGSARLEGRLYRCQDGPGDLASHLLHDSPGLRHVPEALADRVQLGHVRAHLGRDTSHRPREIVDHVHNERQFENGL